MEWISYLPDIIGSLAAIGSFGVGIIGLFRSPMKAKEKVIKDVESEPTNEA